MKTFYRTFLTLLSMLAIVVVSSTESLTKGNGAPLANTGSPGDGSNNTCAKIGCHNTTVNTGSGSVTIDVSDIPASGYRAGETYTIGVQVQETGRFTFGFQLTAEDDFGNKKGIYADNGAVKVEFTNWVTHKISNGTGLWTFDWTAPSGTNDITFYAAGNAANGNGNGAGDNIYTSNAKVSKDITSSISSIEDQSEFSLFNNGNERILFISSKKEAIFNIYSINGSMVKSFVVSPGNSEKSIHELPSGFYIVSEAQGKFTKRLVLQ